MEGKVDCKTVRIFAYSSTGEQSNKRSETRLKTESETWGETLTIRKADWELTLNTMTLVLIKNFLTQTVYVDAPAVPTAVAETQTLKVIYKYA